MEGVMTCFLMGYHMEYLTKCDVMTCFIYSLYETEAIKLMLVPGDHRNENQNGTTSLHPIHNIKVV